MSDPRTHLVTERPGYSRAEALRLTQAARAAFPELRPQDMTTEVERGQSTQVLTVPPGGGVALGTPVRVPSPGPFDARGEPFRYSQVVVAGSTDFDATAAGLTDLDLELFVWVQPLSDGSAQPFDLLGRGQPAVCELVPAGPQLSIQPRVTGVGNVAALVVEVRLGGVPAVTWSRQAEAGS